MASKISKYQAQEIARLISHKAFEHLIKPYQAHQHQLAIEVYGEFLKIFDGYIDKLEECHLISKSKRVSITVKNKAGQECNIQTIGEYTCYEKNGWGALEILNDAYYDLVVNVTSEINKLNHKRYELEKAIQAQCQGKSPASVMKAWPEAGEILTSVMGSIEGGSLTAPLESLLARFLPMLPAPTQAA